jgi:hypothetical protein
MYTFFIKFNKRCLVPIIQLYSTFVKFNVMIYSTNIVDVEYGFISNIILQITIVITDLLSGIAGW